MPYKLEEDNGGYYVVNEQTGKRKNKTPISKERAVKYMRALYAAENGSMKEQILDAFTEKMEFVSDDQRKAVFANMADSGGGSSNDPYDTKFRKEYWKLETKKMKFSEYAAESLMSNKEPGDRPRVERAIKLHLEKMREFENLPESRQKVHLSSKRPEVSYASSISGIYVDPWRNIERGYAVSHGGKFPFASKEVKTHGEQTIESPPALMVYKDAAGADRWVLFSSNAYQDRDKEIVSQAALEADVARADKEHNYGPLRWWHVGKPDPIKRLPGPGIDLGTCDFNAMHGRVLIESGTFNNPKVAAAVKEIAPLLQVSIGYFHPRTEPDSAGVFNNIQRFERSILPAGRASNPFTAVSVIQKSDNGGSEMISEKIKAFAALLKDDELVQSILAQAEQKEKEAQNLNIAFKESEPEAETGAITEKDETQVGAVLEMATEAEPVEKLEEVELEPTIGDLSPDAFTGLLAEAMGKAMEPYQKELKEVQASIKMKDDSEAALRAAVETQAQTITTLKSQLEELLGQQPRATKQAYRDSQSAETIVKDDSRVKGKQPTVDPAFIQFVNPLGGS